MGGQADNGELAIVLTAEIFCGRRICYQARKFVGSNIVFSQYGRFLEGRLRWVGRLHCIPSSEDPAKVPEKG